MSYDPSDADPPLDLGPNVREAYDKAIANVLDAWMVSAQSPADYQRTRVRLTVLTAQLLNDIAETLDKLRQESRWEGPKP